MTSIIKEVRLANGRSHRCEKCPFGYERCTLELHRVCSDNFVEGFIKVCDIHQKENEGG